MTMKDCPNCNYCIETLRRENAELKAEIKRIKDEAEDIRAETTEQVFKAVCEHMVRGGTYRYLIYDRLGFAPEYYTQLTSGLAVSNFVCDALRWKKALEDIYSGECGYVGRCVGGIVAKALREDV